MKLIILTDQSLTFSQAQEKMKKLGLVDDDGNIIKNCTMHSGKMSIGHLFNILKKLEMGKTVVLHDVSGAIDMI